jgi:hypothetical protein
LKREFSFKLSGNFFNNAKLTIIENIEAKIVALMKITIQGNLNKEIYLEEGRRKERMMNSFASPADQRNFLNSRYDPVIAMSMFKAKIWTGKGGTFIWNKYV